MTGWLLVALAPTLVGLWVAATTFAGGTLWPWHPVMVDLDVYRSAALTALRGADPYDLPGQLPFLYPPFAAVLAVPLALLPAAWVQVGWVVANVAALLAVMRRFGLRGWALSLLATVAVYAVEPVQQTLAFGQVGILLVALVVVDLVPHPDRADAGDRPRTGVLTGLAAAVKLTPSLFAVYAFLAGRRRVAYLTVGTFVASAVVTAVLLPGPSATFWGRLAHGDTGLGHSVIYYTNQSVLGSWLRVFGLGAASSVTGLAVSAGVAALGVVAAVAWHRRGEVGLAVCLGGLASLLASPVSWSHHFVWVVPLALALGRLHRLPGWFRCLGLVFVGWVAVAPYKRLPNGADVELTYTPGQNLLDSVTLLLGLAVLVGGLVAARRDARGRV